MSQPFNFTRLFIGTEPRMRRMLGYWAATCVLYTMGMLLMFSLIDGGVVDNGAGTELIQVGMTSIFGCYLLIRFSDALGLKPAQLAVLQSLLATTCNVAAYALLGPVRGASLMMLLVVVVFCTFSLRTRATLLLCAVAIVELAVTMSAMVAAHPALYPARDRSGALRPGRDLDDRRVPADGRDEQAARPPEAPEGRTVERRWRPSAPWPPWTN